MMKKHLVRITWVELGPLQLLVPFLGIFHKVVLNPIELFNNMLQWSTQ